MKRPKNTFLLWNHSVTSENIRSCFSLLILLRRDLHVKAAIFLHLAESSFIIIIQRERKNSPQYLCRRSYKETTIINHRYPSNFWPLKRKRGVFAALYSGAVLALSGLHVKAAELLKWDHPVVGAHRECTAAPALLWLWLATISLGQQSECETL